MSDDFPCVCARLRRASRAVTRLYDDALAPAGLTVTQFSLMGSLSRMDRPSLSELAAFTAHEKSALWRTLQPLIRQGWVEAVADEDRRARRLSLTGDGRRRLGEAMPRWRTAQARMAETLGPREAALMTLLTEVEAHV